MKHIVWKKFKIMEASHTTIEDCFNDLESQGWEPKFMSGGTTALGNTFITIYARKKEE
jgi:hypothetical protein